MLITTLRQKGQDTVEELRSKDFRKDLEERERQAARERTKEKGSRSAAEQTKRPRLDQPPPSNLDADDPVDDDDDDDSDERCVGSLYFLSPLNKRFYKIYFVLIAKKTVSGHKITFSCVASLNA